MKPAFQTKCFFLSKSLLWSVLLYVLLMAGFNWEEVRNTFTGKNNITVVKPAPRDMQTSYINELEPVTPSISEHTGAVHNAIVIVKTIIGVSAKAATHEQQ
jgi:hypothetical protein